MKILLFVFLGLVQIFIIVFFLASLKSNTKKTAVICGFWVFVYPTLLFMLGSKMKLGAPTNIVVTILLDILYLCCIKIRQIKHIMDIFKHLWVHLKHCFKCYSKVEKTCLDNERCEITHIHMHPLKGKSPNLLNHYLNGLLLLLPEKHPEGNGHAFIQLVNSLDRQEYLDNNMHEMIPRYDDIAIQQEFTCLKDSADFILFSCFLCDLVRLHVEDGGANALPARWKDVCKDIFNLNDDVSNSLEHLCTMIARRQKREPTDDFGQIPESVVTYYLPIIASNTGTPSPANNDNKYLVIDISGGPKATSYPHRYTNEPPDPLSYQCRMSEIWLRRIPKGTFSMGSSLNELGRDDNETQHSVKLTDNFYIGVFPVTQRQWELVTGKNPSTNLKSGYCAPVEYVSYDDICGKKRRWPLNPSVSSDSFLGQLNNKVHIGSSNDSNHQKFDLPTEAEWEYACRAGTLTCFNVGQDISNQRQCIFLEGIGWYRYNSDGMTHPVGEKAPNEWGLYDMHGNIGEWCRDWFSDYQTGNEVISNPY